VQLKPGEMKKQFGYSIKIIVVLVTIITCDFPAYSQNKSVVISNVDDAIDYVLKENPDLETYQLNQRKSIQEYKNQKLSLLPSVSGSFGSTYTIELQTSALPGQIVGQEGTVNVKIGAPYTYNTGLSLSWDAINPQKIIQTKLAKLNNDIEISQTEAYRQKLIEQTVLYYYAIVITQESISNHKKNLAIADSIVIITEDRHNQGINDVSSVNLSKISANNIKQTILNNQMLLNQYVVQLKILMGLVIADDLQIQENLEKNSVSFSDSKVLKPDKSLKVYDLQLQYSEQDIKTKQAAYYPILSANAYYGYLQLKDDFGMSFDNNAWDPYSYVGLNLSIPIFTGNTNKGNVEVAKIKHQINEQNLETEIQKSKLNDAQLIADYKNSLEQLNISQESYQLFKQNVDLAFERYSEGIIGIDSYYIVFEDYLKMENNYLNSISSVYTYYSTILSRQQ
jgi:outer membrane protein TolC